MFFTYCNCRKNYYMNCKYMVFTILCTIQKRNMFRLVCKDNAY